MRILLIALSALSIAALPAGTLAAAPEAVPTPVGQPQFAQKLSAAILLAGKSPGDKLPPEVEAVFNDVPDGSPPKPEVPVSVHLKAASGHPTTYVLGEAVKLSIEETGDIRERHWEIDPPVTDFCHPDPVKRDSMWWVSPSTGEYTVIVTSVGRSSGIATDRMKVKLIERASGGQASVSGMSVSSAPAGEKPDDAARRALATVDPDSRQIGLAHVRDVVNASNTLSEARAYLLRPTSLGADRAKAWQSFFGGMEKYFDAMRTDGKLPTDKEERGAMEALARVMGDMQ